MWIILIIGESGLAQPYMRTRYEWYYPQIAQYTSITRFTSLAVQALLIPLVKFFEYPFKLSSDQYQNGQLPLRYMGSIQFASK